MTLLEQIVEQLSAEQDEACKIRSCALLSQLADNQKAAREVWTQALEQACGEAQPFTFVLWFGAERAKQLHRLHLEQRRLGAALTELTRVAFSDSMGIVEAIDIVEAYAQPDAASGPERANTALETLARRAKRLQETIAALSAI